MKFLKLAVLIYTISFLIGCVPNMNPTGNSTPNYPFYTTTKSEVVKHILVPAGTKLTYEEILFKKGEQNRMMSETKLTSIELQNGATINWAGVPVTRIDKFFNSDMSGFSVYADFDKLSNNNKNKFTAMWNSCNDGIGISVKNTDDWSFNLSNISDIESCSVIYQRFFKDDANVQKHLDSMYVEMKKIGK